MNTSKLFVLGLLVAAVIAATAIIFGLIHWVATGVNAVTVFPLALGLLFFAFFRVRKADHR
jgi:hypothetical protein